MHPDPTAWSTPQRRRFHDYFVTHIPSSSLHPDSRPAEPGHKLPRNASTPHGTSDRAAAPPPQPSGRPLQRATTVVRIPLRSAKHHFGVSISRGQRPYNEDDFQAGTIELPAFAKRAPISLTKSSRRDETENKGAQNAQGDPQVFYFGVFDGHGGNECSKFLRERLHEYIERTAVEFKLQSSLERDRGEKEGAPVDDLEAQDVEEKTPLVQRIEGGESELKGDGHTPPPPGDPPLLQEGRKESILNLEKSLLEDWKRVVGGYFKRFKPSYFSAVQPYQSLADQSEPMAASGTPANQGVAIEEVLSYAFLRADLDFIIAQAAKKSSDNDIVRAERPLNDSDILDRPSLSRNPIGGPTRFKGGSTCSIAMISTPTPAPFWHPSAPASLLVSHVGDTRIILCSTKTGYAVPLTTNHHPSSPIEGNRLRRYAATFVTDSFGEERMSGLANTRSFGDISSKRIGVSAEPEIRRFELAPAEYAFVVLVSDGISGTLSDQEICDIVKESRTPDQGAKDVVSFATEVSREGDNATCLVVRLGGWERRSEGGLGSMGTKEMRDFKKEEATNPRTRRT